MMVLFAKYQVEFVSYTEKFDTSTPMGRAMLNICMVFAQLERETIQQRVTDAYYFRSEKGFYMGGRVPYGFRLAGTVLNGKQTKTYILCEEEADQIKLMYKLYSDPAISYGDILFYFTKHGITCRGKPWTRARIADRLKNPVYVRADLDIYEFFQQQGTTIESPQEDFIGINGCYYYKGRDTRNRKQTELKENRLVLAPHEGFVSSDIWLKCRTKCLKNKQVQPGRKAVNTWLSGLVKCGNCHYALTFKKYSKRQARYLLCSQKTNAKACVGAGTIYADEFEAMIYHEIVKKLEESPVIFESRKAVAENSQAAALRIELNKISQEIESLVNRVTLANETLMLFINRRVEELTTRQTKLELELADYNQNRADSAQANQISDYLAHWDYISLADKRKIAGTLIEIIYATSEKVDIHWRF